MPRNTCLNCVSCVQSCVWLLCLLWTHLWGFVFTRKEEREKKKKRWKGSIFSSHYALTMVFDTHYKIHLLYFTAATRTIYLLIHWVFFIIVLKLLQGKHDKRNRESATLYNLHLAILHWSYPHLFIFKLYTFPY